MTLTGTKAEVEADVSDLRAVFVTNSPAPYRDQLYRALTARFAAVKVCYTDPPSADRTWRIEEGCPSERLRTWVPLGSAGSLQTGVLKAVRSADVLFVGGYETCTYVLALLLGRIMRRRVVLFFDGIAPSRLSRRGLKHRLKRVLVRLPHVCLVNGAVGREYFEVDLGVPGARLGNQYLVPVAPSADAGQSQRVDVLFVGRLIERKGVADLLTALRNAPDLSATVIGDGPLRYDLETLAQGLDVEFAGELEREEIDGRMRAAGCLVVPSRDEPWGLVVHEAIQCDLAVVVSRDVGSMRDLVVEGVNGFGFPPGDARGLLDAVRSTLALNRTSLMAENAELLKQWSLQSHVAAFVGSSS